MFLCNSLAFQIPNKDPKLMEDICTRFNQKLIFSPENPSSCYFICNICHEGISEMAFSVRDPVFNATFPPTKPRGFADLIRVKSRGYDAHLVRWFCFNISNNGIVLIGVLSIGSTLYLIRQR